MIKERGKKGKTKCDGPVIFSERLDIKWFKNIEDIAHNLIVFQVRQRLIDYWTD